MVASTVRACKQPTCQVAQTGNCLEGLETAKCPHFITGLIAAAKAAGDPAAPEVPPQPEVALVDLAPGTSLTPEGAADFLRSRRMQVIVVAGDEDSGKTTLLTSIYESLQASPMAGYRFAGSSTLPGFELRWALSRALLNFRGGRLGISTLPSFANQWGRS